MSPPTIVQVPPPQWNAWLQAVRAGGQQPLLLDVREPQEVAYAPLKPPGCEVLALPMHTIPQQWHSLDPERPTACLCHHGVRSMQVAAFLLHHGFEQVANVTGGIDAWSLSVDPGVPRY